MISQQVFKPTLLLLALLIPSTSGSQGRKTNKTFWRKLSKITSSVSKPGYVVRREGIVVKRGDCSEKEGEDCSSQPGTDGWFTICFLLSLSQDEHDLRVFRLCALWFANCPNISINTIAKVRDSFPFHPLIWESGLSFR